MTAKVQAEIDEIFEQNRLNDLKFFMGRRRSLNNCNLFLVYLFHIIQSAGVLTTTIAAGYDIKYLVWIGTAMNIVASLIHVFEKQNDSMSKRMLKDIVAIQKGTQMDEGVAAVVENHHSESDSASVHGSANQPLLETVVEKY